MAQTILVAEDDGDIQQVLRLYLESEGYTVLLADNGVKALELALVQQPELAILDVMMPQMDGWELTRQLRRHSDLPILILSAKDQDTDKVLGLNLGADDYLAKPFSPLELMARVRALLRRAGRGDSQILTAGSLSLDITACALTKDGAAVALTPMEYKILTQLMRSPGRVFTKKQLYEATCGDFFVGDDNTVMVHISKLREKIEDDPKNPRYIVTVRGVGYKLAKQ